jgi:Putative peptidoglycan binding domain
VPAGQFQQNRRIQGSDQWLGPDYEVFRKYRSEWHDRDWWRRHYSRIVFGAGGWYYWNSSYWFPAWGYDPNANYEYDGPIYGHNDLPPDQVIADVQAALQKQGYYQGEVDGRLGLHTQAAIADYQRDHGLYITSTIDWPTHQSLPQ